MSNKLVKNSLLLNKHYLESSRIGFLGMPPFEQNEFVYPFEVNIELVTEEHTKEFINLLGPEYNSILSPSKLTKKYYWYPRLKKGEMNTSTKYIWVEDNNV